MIHQGLSTKQAADMGHIPQSGENGLMHVLQGFPNTKKILIHINNTNPILNENSTERKILSKQSIEVAEDGMMIEF
jgi:pyrroloquinoline quinone biosynthesis protein B